MTKKYIILLLSTLFVSIAALQAQIYDEQGQYVDTIFHDHINRSSDDFIKVSFVVVEPIGAVYSSFGHSFLRLVCDTFNLDYIYSYESEDEAAKLLSFLAGKLRMGLAAVPTDEYLQQFIVQGRRVVEYPLLLPSDVKQRLWKVLDDRVNNGMSLPYDFNKRGCAYACQQLVDKAIVPDHILYAPWTEKQMRTKREMCYDYATKTFPWNMWFIMTIVGTDVDKSLPPEEKFIIPTELVEAWSTATLNGEPVLGEAHEIIPSHLHHQKVWFTPVLVALLLLISVLLGWIYKFDYADYVVLTICTIMGVLVSYLVVVSKLPCTSWNWLIIPFNLLPAIFWHWRKYWGIYYAGLIVIWFIVMAIIPHRQVDPANNILALTFAIVLTKQWWIKYRKLI